MRHVVRRVGGRKDLALKITEAGKAVSLEVVRERRRMEGDIIPR
ncbi:MAG: hypothetical protein ABFS86_01950 [Planctomycetota bacterium]